MILLGEYVAMQSVREILDSQNLLIYVFVILLLAIELIFIRLGYKKHEEDIKNAGRELIVLKISKDFVSALTLGHVAVLIPLVMNITANASFKFLYILIIVVILVSLKFKAKTQKICENGILMPDGLLSWNKMEKISLVKINGGIINIDLNCYHGLRKNITIWCSNSNIKEVVEVIETQIDIAKLN